MRETVNSHFTLLAQLADFRNPATPYGSTIDIR
jgi:hypothetical protein